MEEIHIRTRDLSMTLALELIQGEARGTEHQWLWRWKRKGMAATLGSEK